MNNDLPHRDAGRSAVGYLRRSTDRQEQSIPDQKKALIHYAEVQGIHLLDFYTDDAISGTSTHGRRAFQKMIADSQKPGRPWNMIVVYDVKRFGRVDNDEAGHYRHILRQHGVEVRYVSENFTGDGTDDLLRPVKQWQAREESKDLSKVTIRGLLSRVQGGVWMGGAPPFGYDLRYENDKGEFLFALRHQADGSKLVLDEKGKIVRALARGDSIGVSKRDHAKLMPGEPERVKALQDIFWMCVSEGKGYRAIADSLNRKNIPSPRNAGWSHIYHGKWGDSSIREILANPVYTGDTVWNRRTDGRFHKIANGVAVAREKIHSRRLARNDKSDWIRVKATHPPLIDHQTFENAQKRRGNMGCGKKGESRPPLGVGIWTGSRSRFILSGLLYCGACGRRYHGCHRTKGEPRKDGTPIRTFYYDCSGYIRSGKGVCPSHLIPQEKIEQQVIKTVLDYYGRFRGEEGEKKLQSAVCELMGSSHRDIAKARKRGLKEQKQIEKKMNNLLDSISPENRDLVDRRLKTLRQDLATCTLHLEQLDALAASQIQERKTTEDVTKFLDVLSWTLKEGVPEEKRLTLRRCVNRIVLEKKTQKVEVTLRCVPVPNAQEIQIDATLAD